MGEFFPSSSLSLLSISMNWVSRGISFPQVPILCVIHHNLNRKQHMNRSPLQIKCKGFISLISFNENRTWSTKMSATIILILTSFLLRPHQPRPWLTRISWITTKPWFDLIYQNIKDHDAAMIHCNNRNSNATTIVTVTMI